MRGKNQVFAGHKRQSVHHEGNNALSSRRRNAISRDPSVGDKVELFFDHELKKVFYYLFIYLLLLFLWLLILA